MDSDWFGLKAPNGTIYPWSLCSKEESCKKKANRWSGWEEAKKAGYSVVKVKVVELLP